MPGRNVPHISHTRDLAGFRKLRVGVYMQYSKGNMRLGLQRQLTVHKAG